MKGNLRFKINWKEISWKEIDHFLLYFSLYLRAISKYKPPPGGGLIFGGVI